MQLRPGYSPLLNSFNSRIDGSVKDVCLLCQTGPHNAALLINCFSRSTMLTLKSLWLNPVEAANFLKLRSNDTTTTPKILTLRARLPVPQINLLTTHHNLHLPPDRNSMRGPRHTSKSNETSTSGRALERGTTVHPSASYESAVPGRR